MSSRVLIYAQHILGIGHLVRASRIARALQNAGGEVVVVLGGAPVVGVDWGDARLEQLEPIRAGEKGYADLIDAEGNPVSDQLRERRRIALKALFEAERPDAVIVEAFPFGRRAMRHELIPALELARSWVKPPVIASSLRDILHENRKKHLNLETAELAERLFDLVLVHGDPELIALGESYPETERIAPLIRYTGVVAPVSERDLEGAAFDVVASAGGGAVGQNLLMNTVGAVRRCAARDASWCLITGPNLDEETGRSLRAAAPPNVSVVEFRSDFVALLRRAKLSISQAGYNTAADVLTAGCRCVLVPSAYQGETEQTRRAWLLEAKGLAHVVEEDALTPQTLAGAIDRAWNAPPPGERAVLDLNGAAATAKIVLEACEAR